MKLKDILVKTADPGTDCEFYMQRVLQYQENEWIYPTNENGFNDYFIFFHLHSLHLVEKLVQPIWKKGSYAGNKVYFRWNRDLQYPDIMSVKK